MRAAPPPASPPAPLTAREASDTFQGPVKPTARIAVLLAGWTLACAPAPEAVAPEASRPAPPPPPAMVETLEEEEAAGRDLTQLVVCDLLPGEEVAAVLGGVLYAEPSPTAGGTMWNECAYLVRDDAQAPEAKLVTVRFYAPEHFELARGMAENPTDVPGIGNEAFSSEEPPLFVLTVLQQGDVALEVRAESSPDDARALAEIVLDRLFELPV